MAAGDQVRRGRQRRRDGEGREHDTRWRGSVTTTAPAGGTGGTPGNGRRDRCASSIPLTGKGNPGGVAAFSRGPRGGSAEGLAALAGSTHDCSEKSCEADSYTHIFVGDRSQMDEIGLYRVRQRRPTTWPILCIRLSHSS
jgi:hypothetical protein